MALNSNEHWTLIFSPLLLITLTSFFKKKLYYYSTNPQIFNVLHYNEDLDNNMREFYCKSQSYINDEKHMKIEETGELVSDPCTPSVLEPTEQELGLWSMLIIKNSALLQTVFVRYQLKRRN